MCISGLVCVFGGLDHPARTCQGVSEEGAMVGGGGRERARGREEGHTHGPAVHPASGPHLELDTASPRAGRGDFREKNVKRRRERKALCVLQTVTERSGTSSTDPHCCNSLVSGFVSGVKLLRIYHCSHHV